MKKFSEHVGRRRQIFNRLSQIYRIIYFSQMRSFIYTLKANPKLFFQVLRFKIVYVNSNFIYVHLPEIFLPFNNYYRILNIINNYLLRLFIFYIKKRLKINDPDIWWVGYPFAVEYVKQKSNLIYDCFDDHWSWKGHDKNSTIRKIEIDLLKSANITFFSSSNLFRLKSKYANKAIELLNGADYSHFFQESDKSINKNKIVLYSGVISNWVDIKLIEYCISNLEDFQFWFVGPVRNNLLDSVKDCKNIKIFGMIDYNLLPEFYHKSSITIIPFNQYDNLIKSTNPIKLYEYFASGKPVVSTRFEEVEKYADHVYIADNKEEFAKLIIRANDENNIEKISARQSIAYQNSWELRIKVIDSEIINLLN